MDNVAGLVGDPPMTKTRRSLFWLQRSKSAALVWNVKRTWLGVMWRTSNWISVDGLIFGHHQRRDDVTCAFEFDRHDVVVPGAIQENDVVPV